MEPNAFGLQNTHKPRDPPCRPSSPTPLNMFAPSLPVPIVSGKVPTNPKLEFGLGEWVSPAKITSLLESTCSNPNAGAVNTQLSLRLFSRTRCKSTETVSKLPDSSTKNPADIRLPDLFPTFSPIAGPSHFWWVGHPLDTNLLSPRSAKSHNPQSRATKKLNKPLSGKESSA